MTTLLKSKDQGLAHKTVIICIRLCIVLSILCGPSAFAANRYTMTLTVTNLPVTSNTIVFSSPEAKTITWTNNTASTFVTTNTSIGGAATNLYLHFAAYTIGTPRLIPEFSSSNIITLTGERDQLITAVATNNGLWASITYTTNPITTMLTVRVPIASEPGTNPTYIASQLVKGQSDLSTNSFATNAQSLANHLSRGIPFGGGTQTVSSEVFLHKVSGTNAGRIVGGHYASPFLSGPSLTNGINYGNAFRSPGTGANSEQFGTGALADGQFGLAVGASAYSGSNVANTAIGNSATCYYLPANRHGEFALAFGPSTRASGTNSGAVFFSSVSDYNDSYAIAGTTTANNQIRIGGSGVDHWVSIPGVLQAAGTSNLSVTAGSSNVMRGSYSYPWSAMSTLANGNNIAIVLGTNRSIRFTGTLTNAAICGIAGGYDGLEYQLRNELGSPLTLAENTVDPTEQYRFDFTDNLDVSIVNGGEATIRYKGSGSTGRWTIGDLYPAVSAATNGVVSSLSVSGSASIPTNTASFSITTNDFVLNAYYTNTAQRAFVCATITMTNVLAADVSSVGLYVDQAGDGTFEHTGTIAKLNGVALLAGAQELSFFIQPGARFCFTNISSGASPVVAISAMSSQWVKQ